MDNTQKPGSPFDINPPLGGVASPPPPPPPPPQSPTFPIEPPPPTPFIPTPPPPPPPAPSPLENPLDNPWGAPPQPPPISTPATPPPWTPPQAPAETFSADSPPTDLSHLVGNNPQAEPIPTNSGQVETLVVPPAAAPEAPAEPTDNVKRGVPKWLIGVGMGLLLAVLGVSAYFILGIGQAPKGGSVPAVPTQATQEVKPPAPLPTPATSSASFGQLEGTGQSATSAADLIRQRQKQGR